MKTILVDAAPDDRQSARFDIAAHLAGRFDAQVTGLLVSQDTRLPQYATAEVSPQLLDALAETQRAAAVSARDTFEHRMGADGLKREWRSQVGNRVQLLTLHARYADLAVLSQADPTDGAGYDDQHLPAEIALHAGRPVLVVPYAGKFEGVGETILVAWNGSREATRAMHDAMPLLTEAARVLIHVVNPPDRDHIAGADIATHLARHGVKVEVSQSVTRELQVGDELLNLVSDRGADLVVMGAYGHSPIREAIFGGPTRDVLDHMTVPVLMAH